MSQCVSACARFMGICASLPFLDSVWADYYYYATAGGAKIWVSEFSYLAKTLVTDKEILFA